MTKKLCQGEGNNHDAMNQHVIRICHELTMDRLMDKKWICIQIKFKRTQEHVLLIPVSQRMAEEDVASHNGVSYCGEKPLGLGLNAGCFVRLWMSSLDRGLSGRSSRQRLLKQGGNRKTDIPKYPNLLPYNSDPLPTLGKG